MSNSTRDKINLDSLDEEIGIARGLRDGLLAERESIEALTPAQQERLFARIENILELLEKLERLKVQRAAILRSRGAS
jgi:hypothetical protein